MLGFAEQVAHIEKRVAHIKGTTAVARATSLETKEEMARKLGVVAGESCPSAGQAVNMGCNIGCQCRWNQQCYPRDAFWGDGKDHESLGEPFDVGVCHQAMPNLMIMCLGCFFGLLACAVLVRVVIFGTTQAEKMERQLPPSSLPCVEQGAAPLAMMSPRR